MRKLKADEPPYLAVGTEVSAKYKGAFCEAKIRKVVRSVKCKVIFKQGLGTVTVADDQIKGQIRNGVLVEARHPEKKEFFEATIAKVQDCSQYTVVFDDGDITTLRRTALCLKSGRHFAESETLDQLPLTHPEHFSNPVIGGRRGRRHRTGPEESSEDEEAFLHLKDFSDEKEEDIGRVVCVEGAEKKKQKDNWFPGLVVAPTAQDTVPIDTRLEYLVRSFKDGRYYTVPKKEALEFTREIGLKVENGALKAAVEKAYQFLDKDELPPHWDRDSLFGLNETMATDSDAGFDYESSDDEPREEKDHFVAQLYKFMDDSGTPINKGPTIGSQDVDLYRLFKVVQNLGGFNRVTNQNNWKIVSHKIGFGQNPVTTNMVKQSYKKYLYSFEEFYRKLGCTMVNHPRTSRNRNRSNRSLIRDRDKAIKAEQKMEYKDKQDEGSYDSQAILNTSFIKVEENEPIQEGGYSGNVKQEKNTAKNSILEEPKIKIEPPDDKELKCEIKECKKTPRQKKIRSCLLEQITNKTDNNKTPITPKEKKRRLFTRAKKEKDKSFAVKKSPIATGCTRQKRILKDKEKTIVEHFKLKTTKISSSLGLPDSSEKVSTSRKNKDESLSSRSKKDDSVPVGLEEKKKGRKRKEKAEVIDEGLDTLPTYKTVSVGDKLKVYYGPKHDLKVTYEAKVLSIREEGSEAMYLVHYYGWNTRYDEWIKHSRVADNMSWVPGRPSKKSQQTPKGGRKRTGHTTKISNDVTIKVEPESNVTDQHSADICGGVKSDNVTCTAPSFAYNTFKVTRAITRASNKRVASVSENEDYESDNIDIESIYPKKKANVAIETGEGSVNEKRTRKRKSIDIDEKEHKSDDEFDLIKNQRLKKKIIKKNDLNEKQTLYSDKKPLKEYIEIHEYPNSIVEPNNLSNNPPQKFEGFDVSSDEENFLYIAEDAIETEAVVKKDDVLTEISGKLKIISDNPPKGRDFDLNQIRSELKGIETATAVCSSSNVTPKTEEENNIDIDSGTAVVVSLKQEVEDVYEFKEPEPFEFESRKIADDKNKLQRRTLNRYLDESKHSPHHKKKISSPTYTSTKININEECVTKEMDSSETEYSGIETCEEAFDKICASPLRAATEVVPLFEEQVVNDHVEDNLDDDSQDRLIISERYSDDSNLSNTNQKESDMYHEEVKTTFMEIKSNDSQSYEVQIESEKEEVKDHFNKDDWKDEVEDEALNVAIQRAINQESSDDTNDGEILKVHTATIKYDTNQLNIEQDNDSTVKSYDLNKPSSFKYEYEYVEQSTDESVKIIEENINICEKSEEEIETEEIATSPKYLISELKKDDFFIEENKDELQIETTEEIAMKEEIYENQYSDEKTIIEEVPLDEKYDGEASLKPEDVEEEEEEVDEIEEEEEEDEEEVEEEEEEEEEEEDEEEEEEEEEEVEDVDEEEQTLISLLCDEEIIPGSPNPQTDIQEEEVKDLVVIAEVDNEEIPLSEKLKENLCINQEITAKEITAEYNSPPASPDSTGSSCPSPLQERELSPSSVPIDLKNHANDEYDVEPIPLKTINSEEGVRLESRLKKPSEGRASVKKGRRPRKRSQETNKRKYSKTSRHHGGSDSDDVYDSLRMTSSRESIQRPSRSGKYNFTIKLDPELESNQKIALIQQAMQQLRRTYADVKAELAVIDRRRKKLRRRERESAANRFH